MLYSVIAGLVNSCLNLLFYMTAKIKLRSYYFVGLVFVVFLRL